MSNVKSDTQLNNEFMRGQQGESQSGTDNNKVGVACFYCGNEIYLDCPFCQPALDAGRKDEFLNDYLI